MHQPTSAIIIAGGGSRRLGQDKRRLRLWDAAGPTLLEHTVALAGKLCDEVIVTMNDAAEWPGLVARVVPDTLPGAGPLAGLHAGLAAATHPFALVLAADMPFLSEALLRAMLAQPRRFELLALASPAARNSLGIEPLHAVYRCTVASHLQAALEHGERGIGAALAGLQITVLPAEEATRYDPTGRSAWSLNTPEQLAQAQAIIAQR
jgi:molybdopterin-guanine dinucleotide biosynthesis protein A